MRALVFPLEGPAMALQGATLDGAPASVPIPTHSMVTGLVGAALGIRATDGDALQALADEIEHAVIVRKPGRVVQDFQKVRLRGTADETRLNAAFDRTGQMVKRPAGSPGALSVQLQSRPWLADAAFTVAVTGPDLDKVRAALLRPRWPLYLGRTGFLPSRQLDGRIAEGDTLARIARDQAAPGDAIWLPADLTTPEPGALFQMLPGRRDWRTRQHDSAGFWVVCRAA